MPYLAQPTHAGAPRRSLAPELSLALSARDRRILLLARHKLGSAPADFAQTLHSLREAVEELIPAGRVFLLGRGELGPIVGSIISGVGIADSGAGVQVWRVKRDGRGILLGRFLP